MPICLVSLGSNEGNRQEKLAEAAASVGGACAHQTPRPQLVARDGGDWRPGGAGRFSQRRREAGDFACAARIARLPAADRRRSGPATRGALGAAADRPRLAALRRSGSLHARNWSLPHPRMAWRRFVLEPAAEVAGSMMHPTIGWSVARLLAHLNQSMPYVAVTGPIAAGKTRLAERLAEAISAAVDLGAARLAAARRLLRRSGRSGLGRRNWSFWTSEPNCRWLEKGVRSNFCRSGPRGRVPTN